MQNVHSLDATRDAGLDHTAAEQTIDDPTTGFVRPEAGAHAADGQTLTGTRLWIALGVLALGGFGLGASEFVSMGLLPQIAGGLLPDAYAADPHTGIAQAGWLISSYALGVVVGAPVFAVLGARLSRTRLLQGLLAVLIIGTLASALLPSFATVLGARFLAGLPHGAYLGLAALVAGSLMGPGNQGRGIAVALSGLTIANVLGVPAMTALGQAFGWRLAYLVAAAIFAVTLVGVALTVPHEDPDPRVNPRGELRALRSGQLWVVLGLAAVGFGGFFAVYSYLAEVTTQVAGLDAALVPVVLAVVGLGMTAGNALGGRAADGNGPLALVIGFVSLVVTMLLFGWLSVSAPGLVVAAFLVGANVMFVGPPIQSRLIDMAGPARMMAASLNHSAFNVGNALGALFGGQVIALGFGYRAPALVGASMAAGGLLITLVSLRLERAQSAPAVPQPDARTRELVEPGVG